MNDISIAAKGTWPVLLYVVRKPSCWRASVFIDDEVGTIVIDTDFGQQDTYSHWWGKEGRGTETLIEFLRKCGLGYLKDKFSYGRDRWSIEQAERDYREVYAELVAAGEITGSLVEDLLWDNLESDIIDARNVSEFYQGFNDNYALGKLYPSFFDERTPGQTGSSPKAEKMVDEILVPLRKYWENEASQPTARSRIQFAHVHEAALTNITHAMFSVEELLPVNHFVRKQIYKARCEMGLAAQMNRENKDWSQESWVPIITVPQNWIEVKITIGDENGNKNDNA